MKTTETPVRRCPSNKVFLKVLKTTLLKRDFKTGVFL